MTRRVVDTSVILAHLHGEPGSDEALHAMRDGLVSVVNLAEVFTKQFDKGYTDDQTKFSVNSLNLMIAGFTEEDAFQTGALRPLTRRLGLSLGDRACLALGLRSKLPVYTADRCWARLDVGVEIRFIR